MASAYTSLTAVLLVLLSLNTLFFSCVPASGGPCKPKVTPPYTPTPAIPIPYTPTPAIPTPSTPTAGCPMDTLKLAACANVLGGLLNLVIGQGSGQCCSLLSGLADLDAAVCLCTVIKANLLGINLDVPVSLSLLLNECGRVPPAGYKCA